MPLTQSYLAAIRSALIEYLEEKTSIDWRYYDSSISPDMGAKGGIKIFKVSDAPNKPIVIEHCKKTLTLQLRLLIGSNDADELESQLLDWYTLLDVELKKLSYNGISGVFRDVALTASLKGLRPSTRGCQFATEETPSAGGELVEAWKGLLLAEYECDVEIDYLDF